jgi:hypothetical protein
MTWRVDVTRHATTRAQERLGIDTATVVSDVSSAIGSGRLSTRPPRGVHPGRPRGLWAWSADSTRAYILIANHRAFIVTSALSTRTTHTKETAP